jgi:hypothetical protein
MYRLDTSSDADCDGDKVLLASVESVHSNAGINEGESMSNCDAYDADEPLPPAMSAMFEASARGVYQVTKKLTSRFVRDMKSFPAYAPVVEGGIAMVLDMEDMDHLHRCREAVLESIPYSCRTVGGVRDVIVNLFGKNEPCSRTALQCGGVRVCSSFQNPFEPGHIPVTNYRQKRSKNYCANQLSVLRRNSCMLIGEHISSFRIISGADVWKAPRHQRYLQYPRTPSLR